MSELSPEAKRLLEGARDSFSPDATRVSAVREGLAARIAAQAAAGSAGATSAVSSTAVLTKVIAVAVLAAAGGGALLLSTREPDPAPARSASVQMDRRANDTHATEAAPTVSAQPSAMPAPTAPADRTTAAPAASTDRATPQPASALAKTTVDASAHDLRPARTRARSQGVRPVEANAGPVAERAPERERADVEAPATAPASAEAAPQEDQGAEPSAPVAPSDSLGGELSLLRRARAALANDPAEALALVERHAQLYPHATLRQERLATQVLALCGLRRTEEARVIARELERVAPRSPHLMRIRTSCVRQELVR